MTGARIIGETDTKTTDMQNDAQKPVEDSATEVKKKGKWAFKKATSAVKKSHRGVLIQKGDTLWGLSRKYNVSRYAFRCMQKMNNASSAWNTTGALSLLRLQENLRGRVQCKTDGIGKMWDGRLARLVEVSSVVVIDT